MRRSLLAAVLLGVAASSAACHTTRHPATTTPAATVTPSISVACAGSGVRVVSATPVVVHHDRSAVLARLHLDPRATVTAVTAGSVDDPVATKAGLPAGPRTMWLVLTQDPPRASTGPAVNLSPGPHQTLRLVDDATLTPAGAFDCGSG
ncbi:MAG: hypothetical protein QOC82_2202 [Frankiaceae bacterium]|nr:hypothetical protein [Frankiaceae bacterium]